MKMVATACRIPIEFRSRGDVSLNELVRHSGYLDRPEELTTATVRSELLADTTLVDAWFAYSEDKRASSGWYLVVRGPQAYEVGLVPGGDPLLFSDRVDACAEFVVRELAGFRRHAG